MVFTLHNYIFLIILSSDREIHDEFSSSTDVNLDKTRTIMKGIQ